MDPCPRCGSSLIAVRSGEECNGCAAFDHVAAEQGLSPDQIELRLADFRDENLLLLKEERARVAGKSDQQLDAEREVADQRLQAEHDEAERARAQIEPSIPPPAFLTGTDMNPANFTAEQREEFEAWAEKRRRALPIGVPALEANLDWLSCSLVVNGQVETGYAFLPVKCLCMVTDAPSWQSKLVTTIPFLEISEISVVGSDAAERFVTKPRAAAFGLFSLAAKKERKTSYLYIERHRRQALLFRVEGMLPIELQQSLSPFLTWYSTYQEKLLALYDIWHPHR